ncbi:MAG: hypothetical protein VX278_19975 [Myxococcota bacterium]|nr:hypothetical protein [Myxococcota bacterium]
MRNRAWWIPLFLALGSALSQFYIFRSVYWAPGLDGGYYVLQVQSLMQGERIFQDNSLLFPVLVWMGHLTGDVVLGNELAAALFYGVSVFFFSAAAMQMTERRGAGIVTGLYVWFSPAMLSLSSEFLKNQMGMALWSVVWWGLSHRRWWVVFGALGLTVFVHKLMAAVGILTVLLYGFARWNGQHRKYVLWLGILVSIVVLMGVLSSEDLKRFLVGMETPTGRIKRLMVLFSWDLWWFEFVWFHAMPWIALAVLWRSSWKWVLPPLLLCFCAWGLPLRSDELAWRFLLLCAPVTGLLLSMVSRYWISGAILLILIATYPINVAHINNGKPDYEAWRSHIPTLQANIASSQRVVAHRGVCGYISAYGGIHCENFDPQEDIDLWWRVVYGLGARQINPYVQSGEEVVIPLVRGYSLVQERVYRRFREENKNRYSLLRHPRNPYRPRPGYVYKPSTSP